MLDSLALIHTGGRVYDPEIGRFLSADPFIQAPENGQSYNRYSYCVNNPLSLIDPSGYSWLGDVFGKLDNWLSDHDPVYRAVKEADEEIRRTIKDNPQLIAAAAYRTPAFARKSSRLLI
jgi:RHS repeat-associated protein